MLIKLDYKALAEQFCAQAGQRLDSAETLVFGRQLEMILAEPFNVKYVQNVARNLLSFNTSPGPAVDSVTYTMFDETGSAAFVDDYADADFPQASAKGEQFSTFFRSIGASYGYSIMDMRRAQMAGVDLDGFKARAARNAMERKIEVIACQGDGGSSSRALKGIANHSAVTIKNTVSDTADGFSGKSWYGVTPNASTLDVFNDIAAIIKYVNQSTLGIEDINTVILPLKASNYLKTTLFSPTYSQKTVMQVVQEAFPQITFEVWQRLDLMATAGTSGRIVAYNKDSRNVEFMMSQEVESFPPQFRGPNFTVQLHARPGGVQLRYPRTMLYVEGFEDL